VLMDKALRLGLRPVAAGGTSPPLGGTGLSLVLCTRASDRGPLPAAVEAHQESPMSDRRNVGRASTRSTSSASEALDGDGVLRSIPGATNIIVP
jgi:hypothetical protein